MGVLINTYIMGVLINTLFVHMTIKKKRNISQQ
jgi:hypothetical protein